MMTDIDKYLSFVLTMFIAFGVDVRDAGRRDRAGAPAASSRSRSCARSAPYVIVGAFVIGAVFTPPDVVSQLLLAVPLWLLYELGLLLARFVAPPAAGRRCRARRQTSARDSAAALAGACPAVTSTSTRLRDRATILTLDRVAGRRARRCARAAPACRASACRRSRRRRRARESRRGRRVRLRTTPRISTPFAPSSASACATPRVRSCGSMPSQPRVTSPSLMICSSTVARERHRDREADAERAARLREDRAVDADQVARGVDERAARVARVDRRVGLDEILEAVDAEVVAAERAHDARASPCCRSRTGCRSRARRRRPARVRARRT